MESLPPELVGHILCRLATDGWDGQRAAACAVCVSREFRRLGQPYIWPARSDWWAATWLDALPAALHCLGWNGDGVHPVCAAGADPATGKAQIYSGNFHKTLACWCGLGLTDNADLGPAGFVDDLRHCSSDLYLELMQHLPVSPTTASSLAIALLDARDWPGHPDQAIMNLTLPRDTMGPIPPMPLPHFVMHLVTHRKGSLKLDVVALADAFLSALAVVHARRGAPVASSEFVL